MPLTNQEWIILHDGSVDDLLNVYRQRARRATTRMLGWRWDEDALYVSPEAVLDNTPYATLTFEPGEAPTTIRRVNVTKFDPTDRDRLRAAGTPDPAHVWPPNLWVNMGTIEAREAYSEIVQRLARRGNGLEVRIVRTPAGEGALTLIDVIPAIWEEIHRIRLSQMGTVPVSIYTDPPLLNAAVLEETDRVFVLRHGRPCPDFRPPA